MNTDEKFSLSKNSFDNELDSWPELNILLSVLSFKSNKKFELQKSRPVLLVICLDEIRLHRLESIV